MKLKLDSKGFTIVELLIATAILSTILVGASISVLHISKMYYKGVVMSRTQDAARTLVENISRPIQFEGSQYMESTSTSFGGGINNEMGSSATRKSYCLGNQRYTITKNMQVNKSLPSGISQGKIRHAVWRDKVGNAAECATNPPLNLSSNPPASNGESLLGENMRLHEFEITPKADNLYEVKVTVIYGDKELIDLGTGRCKTAVAGSQWCAVAQYNTVVLRRL